MKISSIDHLVLTVSNLQVTSQFYHRVLGMEVVTFGNNRYALKFGEQKINLHQLGQEFEPKAGSADLCLITQVPLKQVIEHFNDCGVPIILGPISRTGANGTIESVYIRDPEQNLLEIANY
ncbi:VOC family virulence protein [Pleurocapsa sp. CCALA 161]|uniref:VOC family protein n=1 Tax=Pleurocapsa sp. CCALA 161 TaxID=2107688 RepID=UPI000D05D4A6|nr:VOC family protein [Pleurocapsa sp. CCALA 161]PSB07416.1 VOC family virulence protein [Pleurocapsa sp. CCALA 161]